VAAASLGGAANAAWHNALMGSIARSEPVAPMAPAAPVPTQMEMLFMQHRHAQQQQLDQQRVHQQMDAANQLALQQMLQQQQGHRAQPVAQVAQVAAQMVAPIESSAAHAMPGIAALLDHPGRVLEPGRVLDPSSQPLGWPSAMHEVTALPPSHGLASAMAMPMAQVLPTPSMGAEADASALFGAERPPP